MGVKAKMRTSKEECELRSDGRKIAVPETSNGRGIRSARSRRGLCFPLVSCGNVALP